MTKRYEVANKQVQKCKEVAMSVKREVSESEFIGEVL
jgi:hypothetical protein